MAQLSSSKVYGDLYVTGDSTVGGSLNSPEFIGKLIGNADSATNCSRSVVAGNGLTGGGALTANRTLTLGTPSTLTNATTNAVTTTSHTHAITTTSVGAVNTIVQTNASGAIGTSRFGSYGTYNSAQTQGVWGMSNIYTVNGTTTGLGTLYGIGYSYISVGGTSTASKHQIHFANNGTATVSIDLAAGGIKAAGNVTTPDVLVGGITTSDKSLKNFINTFNSMFELDGTMIKALKPLYSVGEVSAFGKSDGSSGTGGSGGTVVVFDGLTSTSADVALSANQGRLLNSKITTVLNNLNSYTPEWTSIAGRPTSLSQFTNNMGFWVYNETTVKAVKVSNAVRADNVGGFTVAKSVPSNALFTDTKYTHPTTAGNKHIPTGGSTGLILKWSASGTAVWAAETVGGGGSGAVTSVNGKTGVVVLDVANLAGLNNSKLSLGLSSSATGVNAIALGILAKTVGDYSLSIGHMATAPKSYSIAIGYEANAYGDQSLAIGEGAESFGDYSVAIGQQAYASDSDEVALGGYNNSVFVQGDFSVNGSKNFEMAHPKPSKSKTHRIRHASVETPSAGGTMYRYKVNSTKDGDLQVVELPDYFIYLNKDVQIFVTPQGHFGNGHGVLNRDLEQLEIHCEREGEYNVLVFGTRNDASKTVQEWDDKGVERIVIENWKGEDTTKDWVPNMKAIEGSYFNHEGKYYQAIVEHTTQSDWTPDTTPELFEKLSI